jgi:hypothetical protein
MQGCLPIGRCSALAIHPAVVASTKTKVKAASRARGPEANFARKRKERAGIVPPAQPSPVRVATGAIGKFGPGGMIQLARARFLDNSQSKRTGLPRKMLQVRRKG